MCYLQLKMNMSWIVQKTFTFTMAVRAGSQVFSKSCTKSCIELEMTLKINKISWSRIRLTK